MSNVRLYGRAVGYGSHAVVTRGFQKVLEQAGKLAGFFPLDYPEEDDAPPGATARHGILTGGLNMVRQMSIAAKHDQRWAVVAPNSNYLPPVIVKELRDSGATCLAPSSWAQTVIKKYELPSLMIHHGVSDEFKQADRSHVRETYGKGEFKVLHFSTSAGERKGTLELLQAWAAAIELRMLPSGAELMCVLDRAAMHALLERMVDLDMEMPPQVTYVRRFDFAPSQLSAVLANVHLVCQPSRGEAFGLCSLEARICGVPICATDCTGHGDHIAAGPGVIVIETGADAPIDDGPGALAPKVSPSEITTALVAAYESWPALDRDAGGAAYGLRAKWSWEAALKPFLYYLG